MGNTSMHLPDSDFYLIFIIIIMLRKWDGSPLSFIYSWKKENPEFSNIAIRLLKPLEVENKIKPTIIAYIGSLLVT